MRMWINTLILGIGYWRFCSDPTRINKGGEITGELVWQISYALSMAAVIIIHCNSANEWLCNKK